MKKIDQNPGLTCIDLRASVPGLDEVSRRTVNDVILQDLVLPSRVAVKKPRQVAGRLEWARRHKYIYFRP